MQNNIANIKEVIKSSALRSGRNPEDVTLIAVSKTQPVEMLLVAKTLGLNIFGENKAQELVDKFDKIDDVKWHFIGHLQKNKVKYIIDKVELIHSVDNLELAEEIDRRAQKCGRKVSVLVQVNIGREDTKSGLFEEDALEFIKKISKFENMSIEGLMTIPPRVDNKEEARKFFKSVKRLFEDIKKLDIPNIDFKYLSMGMTGDFDIAIEEGANIVRVGTGIFGERNYSKEV